MFSNSRSLKLIELCQVTKDPMNNGTKGNINKDNSEKRIIVHQNVVVEQVRNISPIHELQTETEEYYKIPQMSEGINEYNKENSEELASNNIEDIFPSSPENPFCASDSESEVYFSSNDEGDSSSDSVELRKIINRRKVKKVKIRRQIKHSSEKCDNMANNNNMTKENQIPQDSRKNTEIVDSFLNNLPESIKSLGVNCESQFDFTMVENGPPYEKHHTNHNNTDYQVSQHVEQTNNVVGSLVTECLQPDNFGTSQNNATIIKNKSSYKRKPDFCYFCEVEVKNFARHIIRNHSLETTVAEILAKPIKSRERRNLLNALRRKGNFLASSGTQCFKPVRETYVKDRVAIPCDKCLGYFSSKLLYRHRKKCMNISSGRGSQAASQSKTTEKFKIDHQLKEQVFPHMRPDKISMEAKNDALICAFGARYLKTHREKHFVYVTSRKMRELSKLLIEVRDLEPTITSLFSALQPKYFDTFVEATKRIARYDVEKDVYLSPTFAMNIATTLKQCCEIAITFAYKKQAHYFTVASSSAEADLKTLIHLFETNWSFEVSSQAANNLSLNKWNKVSIIPLASDLKLLGKHLCQLAESASKILKEGSKDPVVFNKLVESIYCRVILLNRKRSGELQRMYLHTYVTSSSEKQHYEEFNKVISPTEQILLKTLKRIVIRGKRGRGVPVLFSTDVQNHIKIMLENRDRFVPKQNPYIFATANSSSHLIGYKTLAKHAKACGAKNPMSITSTKLRKHLATLTQLFNLSDNEIEQLATFMGHTTGVHRSSYRLPDDIYQTAKISKLLMIMEKGGANEFKGKSLDEIVLDMDENLLEQKLDSGESESDEIEDNHILLNRDNEPIPSTSQSDTLSVSTRPKKKSTKVYWTNEQKDATKMYFKEHLRNKRPPKRRECDAFKSQFPELMHNKDWLKIKVYIQNEYTKKRAGK